MENQNEGAEVVDEIVDPPVVADGDEDATDYKALALKNAGIAKRYKTKLEKSKEVKPEIKVEAPVIGTNEPDYARLAFLEQRGLTNADDQKMVQDEATRLKLPLTDVLGMEHIVSKLKTSKDTREAQAGMPKGRGKAGGQSQNDVDYHLAKGTTPEDVELAEKVINARMKKESNSNKFSDELFTG